MPQIPYWYRVMTSLLLKTAIWLIQQTILPTILPHQWYPPPSQITLKLNVMNVIRISPLSKPETNMRDWCMPRFDLWINNVRVTTSTVWMQSANCEFPTSDFFFLLSKYLLDHSERICLFFNLNCKDPFLRGTKIVLITKNFWTLQFLVCPSSNWMSFLALLRKNACNI